MGTKSTKVRISWGTLYCDNGVRRKDGWTKSGDPPACTIWFESAMSFQPGWHVRFLPSRVCLDGSFKTCAAAQAAALRQLQEVSRDEVL